MCPSPYDYSNQLLLLLRNEWFGTQELCCASIMTLIRSYLNDLWHVMDHSDRDILPHPLVMGWDIEPRIQFQVLHKDAIPNTITNNTTNPATIESLQSKQGFLSKDGVPAAVAVGEKRVRQTNPFDVTMSHYHLMITVEFPDDACLIDSGFEFFVGSDIPEPTQRATHHCPAVQDRFGHETHFHMICDSESRYSHRASVYLASLYHAIGAGYRPPVRVHPLQIKRYKSTPSTFRIVHECVIEMQLLSTHFDPNTAYVTLTTGHYGTLFRVRMNSATESCQRPCSHEPLTGKFITDYNN